MNQSQSQEDMLNTTVMGQVREPRESYGLSNLIPPTLDGATQHYDGDAYDYDRPVQEEEPTQEFQPIAPYAPAGQYIQEVTPARQGHGGMSKTVKVVIGIITVIIVMMGISSIINAHNYETQLAQEASTIQTEQAPVQTKPNANLDLSGIQGQYWSNAKNILESRDADMSNALIITDNGKTPLMDSNWKVTSISKLNNGQLEIHLSQITNYTGDAMDAADGAANKIKGAWNNLVKEGEEAQTGTGN